MLSNTEAERLADNMANDPADRPNVHNAQLFAAADANFTAYKATVEPPPHNFSFLCVYKEEDTTFITRILYFSEVLLCPV